MKLDLKKTNANCSDIITNKFFLSFKLSNLAKAEKSIDARENDMDERENDTHLAGVLRRILRLIDPFNFAPAQTSHSGFI